MYFRPARKKNQLGVRIRRETAQRSPFLRKEYASTMDTDTDLLGKLGPATRLCIVPTIMEGTTPKYKAATSDI